MPSQGEPGNRLHKVLQCFGASLIQCPVDLVDRFTGRFIDRTRGMCEQMLDRYLLLWGNLFRILRRATDKHFCVSKLWQVISYWIEQSQFSLFEERQCSHAHYDFGH